MQRPNILYIFTDQQSAMAMSCTGNPYLHTPHMDALAARGVRFSEAYCSYPLCTPCRASMWTGLMPHQAGVPANNCAIDASLRPQELARLLGDAGYDCGYGGKWHIPDYRMDDPADHGFRLISGFGDAVLADRCIEFLHEQRDRPFFLVASFDNPHNICEWHRDQRLPWGPIEERRLEDCPPLPPNFAMPPDAPYLVRLHERTAHHSNAGVDFSPEDWRRYRSAYYRLVEKVDREIGRVLAALDTAGLRDNTLVVFSSDHGDGEAAHGWNNKQALFEECIRIPWLMALPEAIDPGLVRSDLVSTIDLFPTLCDFAGVRTPSDLPGLSLRPFCTADAPTSRRQSIPVETRMGGEPAHPGMALSGRVLRSRTHKYVCYRWGRNREQLFDLRTDPGEMSNLASCSTHRAELDQHRAWLRDWCTRTEDAEFMNRIPGRGD